MKKDALAHSPLMACSLFNALLRDFRADPSLITRNVTKRSVKGRTINSKPYHAELQAKEQERDNIA